MSQSNDAVIQALRKVLADSYVLLGHTHLCHWNVRGPSFFSLHAAFEAQYTELFTAIDAIAERIRALGALAPGGIGNLARLSGLSEIQEDADASAAVRHLIEVNEQVVESLQVARAAATEADDPGTEDLVIARAQVHEKTIWMLRSFMG